MAAECKAIIFSRPGETGLIPYIGALWAAESINYIDSVSVWICPSTTAFVSVMKICGYSCLDIMVMLITLPQLISSPTPFRNPLNTGISIDEVKSVIGKFIMDKNPTEGKIITLEELYDKTGITLVGIGYCLQRQEIENIHRESYPNMSILDFICISLSVPGIYRPYKVDRDLWIDGSIMESFSPGCIELEASNVLAITTKPKKVIFSAKDPLTQVREVIRCVFESSRHISPVKLGGDMTLVEIATSSTKHEHQLGEGWNAFNDAVGVITIHEALYEEDADLQS